MASIGPESVFPWIALAKAGAVVIGLGSVLAFAYFKGSSDKNAEWLTKENARIISEASETIKGMENAHKLNLTEAKESAAAIARADERASQASKRASQAERYGQAKLEENRDLSNQLKIEQEKAAAAGDSAGLALLPAGVRERLADRLDALCRRRPSQCNPADRSGSEFQDPTGGGDDSPRLAGYPQ